MVKLVYPICCGIDVHKKVIVATIVSTDKAGFSTHQQKSFSTINCDIEKFHNWLIKNNCGQYIKPLLVQCALAAVKCKKEPYFSIKYQHIKKHPDHKKAVIAISRMMLVCIYHIISEEKPFNPTDYTELMDPHSHADKVVLNEAMCLLFFKNKDTIFLLL